MVRRVARKGANAGNEFGAVPAGRNAKVRGRSSQRTHVYTPRIGIVNRSISGGYSAMAASSGTSHGTMARATTSKRISAMRVTMHSTMCCTVYGFGAPPRCISRIRSMRPRGASFSSPSST